MARIEKLPPEHKRTQNYVNKLFEEIEKCPDIVDIIILNRSGNPIKTTMETPSAIKYCGLYGTLLDKVNLAIKAIDPTDELKLLRVRAIDNETFITPDRTITALVIQNAEDSPQM